jgi:hypothetical protein
MHRFDARLTKLPLYGFIALTVLLAGCSGVATLDTTSPTIVPTTPDSDGTAPTNQPITARFDEAIEAATITEATFMVTGPAATPVLGSVSYDASTWTATFTPAVALAVDTAYGATVTSGVTDLAGNALEDPYTWSFTTTADATATGAVSLGTAGDFVLLAKAGVSTTGTTVIIGDVGVSPAALSYVTGFDETLDASGTFATSDLVTGSIYAANLTAPTPTKMTTAISDMETAYTDAAGRTMPDVTELAAGLIGGLVVAPGLYAWGTGVDINTDVTLTGSATDIWILQIAQDLTLANGISVILGGDALARNVFWQVAGQVTLGTDSTFHGVVLSKTAIVMETGAVFVGRALAQTEITLDANAVTQPLD